MNLLVSLDEICKVNVNYSKDRDTGIITLQVTAFDLVTLLFVLCKCVMGLGGIFVDMC